MFQLECAIVLEERTFFLNLKTELFESRDIGELAVFLRAQFVKEMDEVVCKEGFQNAFQDLILLVDLAAVMVEFSGDHLQSDVQSTICGKLEVKHQ